MSARPWTPGAAAAPDREVRLAEWFVPRPAAGEVAALFAPQRPKPPGGSKAKAPSPAAPPPAPSPETKERLALLAAALEEVAEARRLERTHTVELIVELALAVAGELAMGALAAEPARLERLVAEAVGLTDDEQRVRVRLHPEVIALFEASGSFARLAQGPRVAIEADPAVGPHGCVVESGVQRVDGRVSARIERLRALLRSEEGVAR